MALSIGFRSSLSFPPAIQATGPLTLAPVGLSPTEHASLCWTHIHISCSTNHQSKCANWAPAAAGPTPATSAPAAPSSRHRRKLCRLPRYRSKPPPKPSTCWIPSSPGCAVRKGNAPGIQSGSPHPLHERIRTSDARGDRTRTSAWIPATTARGAGGGVRLPAGRLRAFG